MANERLMWSDPRPEGCEVCTYTYNADGTKEVRHIYPLCRVHGRPNKSRTEPEMGENIQTPAVPKRPRGRPRKSGGTIPAISTAT